MKSVTYEKLKEFKKKYPSTVAWRLKKHARIIDMHLNKDEIIIYAFAAQKNDNMFDVVSTNAIVLTNKRLIFGTKRLLFGYFFTSITPDMFNDLTVKANVFWGKLHIDTVKEYVIFSNIQKEALPEIQKHISEYMLAEKRKFGSREKKAI